MVPRHASATSSPPSSVPPFGEAAGKPFDAAQALRLAQETFDIEAAAVLGLKARTGEAFARAVERMLLLRGRVVVMGMGKSGHIGRKIAATLASTGTPALFVHPAEASHGDLGMITPEDLVLAISNGGESDEMTVILPVLKRLGVPLVAMTGGLQSTLARARRHRAGQRRRKGSLPAQPGADGQHHGPARTGRRAGRGAAGCPRFSQRGFRALASRRRARPQAAHAPGRRHAHRRRRCRAWAPTPDSAT